MNPFERKTQERLRRHDADGQNKNWHSRAYHREFEGYAEFPDENGKVKRVYVAEWYHIDLTSKARALLAAELIGCLVLAAALFLLCGTWNIQANKVWYMALCQAAAVIGLLWSAWGILHLITFPEKGMVSQYRRSFEATKKASILSMIAFGMADVSIVFLLIVGCENFLLHLAGLGVYAACVLLMLVINRLNENIPFQQLPNDNSAPEDASIID